MKENEWKQEKQNIGLFLKAVKENRIKRQETKRKNKIKNKEIMYKKENNEIYIWSRNVVWRQPYSHSLCYKYLHHWFPLKENAIM